MTKLLLVKFELRGGVVGATAVCKTGFFTWVLFTDCMITGDWEMACLAVHACTGRFGKFPDIEIGVCEDDIGVCEDELLVEDAEDNFFCNCKCAFDLIKGGTEYSELLIVGVGDCLPELDEAACEGGDEMDE